MESTYFKEPGFQKSPCLTFTQFTSAIKYIYKE